MFSYDAASRVLKVQKIAEPEHKLNLLEYQQESYQKYLNETVYMDIEWLLEAMRENLAISQVKASVRVAPLNCGSYRREIRRQNPAYYPVYAKFEIDGVTYPNEVNILNIPNMDADGIINDRGTRKVLMMQLAAAERISYDADKMTVSLTTPYRNITIDLSKSKDFTVKFGKRNIPIHQIVRGFNAEEGVYDDLAQHYTSPFISSAFAASSAMADSTVLRILERSNLIATYKGTAYQLGTARDALNSALSMDRAKGHTLSRPIGPYPAGQHVDDAVVDYIKKHLINEVYVESTPNIVGYLLSHDEFIYTIPAGTRNNDRLRRELPQFAKYNTIPETCSVKLGISSEDTLTMDDINLLQDVGVKRIRCRRTGTSGEIIATFEEEIIGNCTVRLGDVRGSDIPDGRSFDEWVYYYDNPELEQRDTDHLNTHDWMALYSLCNFIKQHPSENFLLEKDQGLLKKVLAANEIFSNSFRAAAPKFIVKYRSSITRAIRDNFISEKQFFGLSTMWMKEMRDNKVIMTADTLNPIATVAQACHLVSNVSGNIPEKLRLLSMGFYGRICPYETPSGKKLGITNTLATGARIRNGIIETPYRKVIRDSAGNFVGISEELTYWDAQEEAKYRIGDIMSLVRDGYGYANTKVLARVPAPNNQVTVETVDAYSLDAVNAFCEQHLSPTAALVPFAGSDDAVRVTYATNMLKQSVLVQGSQIPRVFTSMYKDCFNHSNTYVIRAKMDGRVDEIPKGKLMVTYFDADGNEIEEDIPLQETVITENAVNFLNFHVRPGDNFKKGDVLVDSPIARNGIYSPGVNLFAAYLADGYNYEDAVCLSENAANQFVAVESKTVKHKLRLNNSESLRAGCEYYYRYIPENGVISKVRYTRKEDPRKNGTEVLRSGRHSGILYSIERDKEDDRNRTYKSNLLSFQRLRVGDKLAGRHSNKGTASIIRKNSEMPCFANGRPLDILLNPCGVPSRMNIGQNFEGYLGFVATLLDVYIQSDAFNGATLGDIKLLMRYVWELANTADAKSVFRKYPMLPSALHEQALSRHAAIREWEGCFNPDGTARLWNPVTGKYLENPVTFGVPYMLQLEHMVNKKLHSRAGLLEEDYSQIHKQPTKGSSAGGGQKMGEMELCNLAAYGASDFLYETCTSSSDSVLARVNTTLRQLNMSEYGQSGVLTPHAVEAYRYYLEVLGYKLTDDEGILPRCDADYAASRSVPDARAILSAKTREQVARSSRVAQALRGEFGDG